MGDCGGGGTAGGLRRGLCGGLCGVCMGGCWGAVWGAAGGLHGGLCGGLLGGCVGCCWGAAPSEGVGVFAPRSLEPERGRPRLNLCGSAAVGPRPRLALVSSPPSRGALVSGAVLTVTPASLLGGDMELTGDTDRGPRRAGFTLSCGPWVARRVPSRGRTACPSLRESQAGHDQGRGGGARHVRGVRTPASQCGGPAAPGPTGCRGPDAVSRPHEADTRHTASGTRAPSPQADGPRGGGSGVRRRDVSIPHHTPQDGRGNYLSPRTLTTASRRCSARGSLTSMTRGRRR